MKKLKQVPVTTERVVEKVTEMSTQVVEEDGGLITLLGKRVLFHCMNYHYAGTLTGVNSSDIELSDAHVVWETGAYNSKQLKSSESLPSKLHIRLGAIEAYWELP